VKSVYIISNAWKPDVLFEITHRIKQTCPDLHLTWSLSIEGPKPTNNAARYTKKEDWDAWQNTIDTMWGLKMMRPMFGYQELDVQLCTVCGPNNVDVMDQWYEMVRDVLQPDKWNLNLLRKSVQMTSHEMQSWESRRQTQTLEPFEAKYHEITRRVREDVLSGKLKFLYHTKAAGDGAMKSAVDLISQADNRRILEGLSPAVCCRAGNDGAYIGSDGQVSGCEEFANNPHENKSFGNLRDYDCNFQAVWHSSAAQAYRGQAGKAPECYGCTLESQKNYPSILVSFKHLWEAKKLAEKIR
jgi:radical SAM protein with 4Fe4S-binding SPASM domain